MYPNNSCKKQADLQTNRASRLAPFLVTGTQGSNLWVSCLASDHSRPTDRSAALDHVSKKFDEPTASRSPSTFLSDQEMQQEDLRNAAKKPGALDHEDEGQEEILEEAPLQRRMWTGR